MLGTAALGGYRSRPVVPRVGSVGGVHGGLHCRLVNDDVPQSQARSESAEQGIPARRALGLDRAKANEPGVVDLRHAEANGAEKAQSFIGRQTTTWRGQLAAQDILASPREPPRPLPKHYVEPFDRARRVQARGVVLHGPVKPILTDQGSSFVTRTLGQGSDSRWSCANGQPAVRRCPDRSSSACKRCDRNGGRHQGGDHAQVCGPG